MKSVTPETISALFRFLLKRSNEAYARAEAMRLLLQQKGGLPDAEFEPLYGQLVTEATQRAEQLVAHLKSAESDAAIRQWLKDFEGTIQ